MYVHQCTIIFMTAEEPSLNAVSLLVGSFTIKCTLGSRLCYSGCSVLSVHNLQSKHFSFTNKSLLDASKWYIKLILYV